jgi:hypothetical protein
MVTDAPSAVSMGLSETQMTTAVKPAGVPWLPDVFELNAQ